ncbi:hypothetical protein BCD67_09685 [Oscillatoriales cyanobacterium USR001]|nr:hypothetical protein BCD67_09685 [Oscillatoriales cyanobacterium USR001]
MDRQLRLLAEKVCSYPAKSLERQKALNLLLVKLQHLPGLLKSSHPDYLEALNRTWEWFSQNICQTFKPSGASFQESLCKWINGYLYWRIRDLKSPQTDYSLDNSFKNSESLETYLDRLPDAQAPKLSGLDNYLDRLRSEQLQEIVLQLEKYIEEDPERKLRNCYPRKHPNCNCQFLTQRLFLQNPADKMADIIRELQLKDPNVKDQTVRSHWNKKCKPLLQEIAVNLGYSPEIEL